MVRHALRRVRLPGALTVIRLLSAAVAFARIARGAHREPPLIAATPNQAGGSQSFSVIIPARDEQDRLGPCLAAIAADPAATDVVVVDDGSTDATVDVARANSVPVIAAGSRPDGWAGKTWALHQGISHATGEWIVALDADTRIKPGLLDAAVRAAQTAGADLVSVGGRFDCSSAGERFLHPAMLCTLVYRFGPPGARRAPKPGRTLANGQCMVLPRRSFLAGGGFAPVADSLTEDVALARHIARSGGTVRFVDGTSLLDVAGYGSASGVWTGWGRSLALADVTPLLSQIADLVLLWVTVAAPLPRLLTGRSDPLDGVLLLARIGTLAAVAGAYRRRGVLWWLSPLTDVAVVAHLTITTVRPVRTWRGRTYAGSHQTRQLRGARRSVPSDGPRLQPWRSAGR